MSLGVKVHPQAKDSRCKLPIPQEVPDTLWLLMDVLYSGCSNGPQRIHQGCRVELRQVCHQQDAHVIFDRYNTSIKDAIRCLRACEAARELTMNAPLPQQQVVLSITKNKVQLIDLICEELQQLDDVPLNTSLVITWRSPVPMEVRSDALVQRFDLNRHMSSFLSKWWRWQIWGVKQYM